MQFIKALSLSLLAALFWNCNEATKPQDMDENSATAPKAVNALVKKAAFDAGMLPKETIDA